MRKLILVVVDGLPAPLLEQALGDRRLPALTFLAEHGRYGRAVSTFPSLTPVCLSSLATGAHPDVHRIPHLVWYHREEERIVEYGSSFRAILAAGTRRSIVDTIFELSERHLGEHAVTAFEALEAAGLTTASVNFTCYRGPHPHRATVPGIRRLAYGPSRFFFFNLFESDVTGAPLAVRDRARGSVDAYAAAVGRWLVTRDGFDFFVYYLSDFDYASHLHGPEGALPTLERTDRAIQALFDASGGPDELLSRYDVVVCADHGQTPVERVVALEPAFEGVAGVLVTASNRAGMVYRRAGCSLDARGVAERLDGEAGVEITLFREDDAAVARRERQELRFRPDGDGWETSGDASLLDHPNALERAWAALDNPNAGDVLVSAAEGYEFTDLGGGHHAGGGSHGSLSAGDSIVPMLTVGFEAELDSITQVAPVILARFGVEPPGYARLSRAVA
jgi:Type I phosphodiesterase / nucleotide pyrophosphatase